MVKDRKKFQENLARFGSGTRKFLVGLSQAQPTTAAIIVMGLTVAVRPLLKRDSEFGKQHLDGLFAASRDLGVAAAVAPVAVGALSSLTAFLERPQPKK